MMALIWPTLTQQVAARAQNASHYLSPVAEGDKNSGFHQFPRSCLPFSNGNVSFQTWRNAASGCIKEAFDAQQYIRNNLNPSWSDAEEQQ